MNWPVASKHFLRSIPSNHLEDSIDIYNWMVRLESVGDDEATRRRLEQVLDGDRKRAAIVEHEILVLVAAEIGIAIPLHYGF